MASKIKSIIYTVILIAGIQHTLKAQLTTLEVYDFNIGQVIQSTSNYHNPFTIVDSLITQTILSKTISVNCDSITYNIKKQISVQGYNMGVPIFNNTTFNYIEIYTNLSQNVVHPFWSGPTTTDSMTNGACGVVIWKKDVIGNTGPYADGYTYFAKGFGGSYYNYSDYDKTVFRSHLLKYYNNGIDSCGVLAVGIKATTKEHNLKIFPNPAENEIFIESSERIVYVIFTDILGNIILTQSNNFNKINTEVLEKGVYIMTLKYKDRESISRKIIIGK